MKLYKLTDQNGQTKNGTQWSEGVAHSKTPCDDPELCSSDVFHAYKNINLAFILNPSHANIDNPLVWLCDGEVCVEDFGKVGVFSLHVKKQVKTPKWVNPEKDLDVRIAFAILCAESVLHIWNSYAPQDKRVENAIQAARDYLKDKNADAADAAACAADAAACAANIDFCKLADEAVKMIFG